MRRTVGELCGMIAIFAFFLFIASSLIPRTPPDKVTNHCPQIPAIIPNEHYNSSSMFLQKDYAKSSQELLSGAIQIPTVVFDDMKSTKDKRFNVFKDLHKYLENRFPLSAKQGNLEYINTYGMLYTFKGRYDVKEHKPLLLLAHQDVVPVDPSSDHLWEHGPFSGHFDGEFVYGRGSVDTKNTLIGILEATESLLQQGWEPDRTLLISFGFDEETIGRVGGANSLARELKARYGEGSIHAIIDEGFGALNAFNKTVSTVQIAEKGYLDLHIGLRTPGGHSSQPPDHTAIGLMAHLINELDENPFEPTLPDDSPVSSLLHCLAEHGEMDKQMKRMLLHLHDPSNRDEALKELMANPLYRSLVYTTQAFDVISGGTKVNALPENVDLYANYRLAFDASPDTVIDKVEYYVGKLAKKFDLGVFSQGMRLRKGTQNGNFTIHVARERKSSSNSPVYDKTWKTIAGTTHHIYEDIFGQEFGHENEKIIVAPGLFPATTDTFYYWDLTRSIYRFAPTLIQDGLDYHTTNERLRFRSHLSTVAWFYEYIINQTLD